MNETITTIHSLRSNRVFSSKEIANEDLEKILTACVRAATASHRQSYSIIVVRDGAVIKKVLGYEGSKALIFCVDYNRIVDTAKHLNHSFSVTSIQDFITGSTDAILAAQTACIAGKSLGIDSFFTNSVHRGNINRIYQHFDLPEEYCFPLISLIMGYAVQEPEYLKGRVRNGVIHYDKYHKLTHEELSDLVQEYDDPQRHLWSSYYEERGKGQAHRHYLDWFYTVWSVRSGKNITEKRRLLYEILKRARFLENDVITNAKEIE